VSPESAEIMAKLGLGVLINVQRSWEDTAADYRRYCETAISAGHRPRPPVGTINVLVANDPHEADDLAAHHMKEIFESVDRHYGFSDGHLSNVKGYEYYGKLAKTYTKLNADAEARAKAAAFYRNLHAAGTPEQVLEKFRYIHNTVAFGHQSATFRIGTLPFPKMERSFKLFAEKVMPVLQHDPAFQVPAEMEEHAEAVH
jgi:alkanesulfonate monooxygenase SsuD/methylene tetrahydromethanopterin reductase-like flavin-dependent oxidoreductase (luciferase family)